MQGFTEYIDKERGQIYRAHPDYMGEAWYNMVMVNWYNMEDMLPAQIYTFVDLTVLPNGVTIQIPRTGQVISAGIYAVAESFSKYTPEAEEDSLIPQTDRNSLIGRYTKDIEPGNQHPTLYLANIKAISGPTVGIPNAKKQQLPCRRSRPIQLPPPSEEYLFLTSCRSLWPAHWDAFMRVHFNNAEQEETDESDDGNEREE